MLCKCHWIVLYIVHFTAFCLGGPFFSGHGVVLFSNENLAYCSFNATPVPLTTQERTEIFSSKTMYSDLLCVMCRYRFRVLDAFGTEAVYNDDEYVKSHPQLENHAGLGRLGLRLKQFYTLYRMYLAFVLPKWNACNQALLNALKRTAINIVCLNFRDL